MTDRVTAADIAAAIATCTAAGRQPGLRPVWRAVVAATGRRPSFTTVARLLAEAQAEAAGAAAVQTSSPQLPEAVVAQVQLLAPAVWQAATAAAAQAQAERLAAVEARIQTQEARERELLAELDEQQQRAAEAEAQRAQADAARHEAHRVAQDVLAQAQRRDAEVQADLAAVRAAAQAHAERAERMERDLAAMAARAASLAEQFNRTAAERDQLRGDLFAAQQRTASDVAINAQLHDALAAARTQAQAAEAATDAERGRADRLAGACDALRQVLAKPRRDPQLRDLHARFARLEARINRVQS